MPKSRLAYISPGCYTDATGCRQFSQAFVRLDSGLNDQTIKILADDICVLQAFSGKRLDCVLVVLRLKTPAASYLAAHNQARAYLRTTYDLIAAPLLFNFINWCII